MENAREIALKTLYQVEYEGAYSNLALKSQLTDSKLQGADRGLATALVYGVLQKKLMLEYIISEFSSVKLKKISKFILLILELGIYQIIFMDKIPESAAVNESVKLARRYGHTKSAGFVNALLRNVVKNRNSLPEPKDKLKRISVKYSFPEWICERWIKEFGEEFACNLMEAMNEDAKMCLRVNALKKDDIKEKIPYICDGVYVSDAVYTSGFDVSGSEAYRNGFVTPQDEAAMLASLVLNPKEGDTVIDMCAAPGGKSTHMAEIMNNKGKIYSFDIYEHKQKIIEENAKRLGIDIISSGVLDASEYCNKYKETADKILVDAPCSGLGIIRRKPEIKWNRNPEDEFSSMQYKILENAARYLKKDGEILYSTCTVEKEENEEVIEKFLNTHPEFNAVDITELLPEKLRKDTAKKGYITLYPGIDKTDGFFIAKIKKVD